MASDGEETVCDICGETPCAWITVEKEIEEYAKQVKGQVDLQYKYDDPKWIPQQRSKCRKKMYQYYTYMIYGTLGRGVRIQTPECITMNVRRLFEDPRGEYLGYCEE